MGSRRTGSDSATLPPPTSKYVGGKSGPGSISSGGNSAEKTTTSSSSGNKSASSGKSAEASVYIRVLDFSREDKEEAYEWFLLNDESEGKILSPIFETLPHFGRQSSVAALGSVIYAFGGLDYTRSRLGDERFSDVYSIDTRCPHPSWKKRPSMLKGRAQAEAVVMDGKIYAVGGFNDYDPPWAEVFDPTLDAWFPLRHTTKIPSIISAHAVLEDQKKFLLYIRGTQELHVYDANQDSWALYESKLGRLSNQAAVVGNIMYFFDSDVYAYNLRKRKWFDNPVGGLQQNGLLPPEYADGSAAAYLFHLGSGRLCLLWGVRPDSDPRRLMHVHCTKFCVSKKRHDGGDRTLVAHAVSSSVFYVSIMGMLQGGLALGPFDDGESESDFWCSDKGNQNSQTPNRKNKNALEMSNVNHDVSVELHKPGAVKQSQRERKQQQFIISRKIYLNRRGGRGGRLRGYANGRDGSWRCKYCSDMSFVKSGKNNNHTCYKTRSTGGSGDAQAYKNGGPAFQVLLGTAILLRSILGS